MQVISNKPKSEPEVVHVPKSDPPKTRRNWLYDMLDLSIWFNQKNLFKSIPFLLYLAVLAMFYIANAHNAEKNMREMDDIEKQLNEQRWQYMTNEADLESMSRQSQLSGKVNSMQLKPLTQPPYLLPKNKHEH